MTLNSTVSAVTAVIVRKDYTDTEFTTSKAALIVFMSVMNVFMFLGNMLSIVTICSSRKLRQQVSYWFVLNLAIIDLLISVTVVPLNTMWEYYGIWPLSKTSCQILTFADMSFSTISAYSIVLVSIDKYIYVTYALRYYERMTRRTAVIMMVSVWIFAMAFTTWWLVSDIGTEDNFKDHFLTLEDGNLTCVYILTDAFIIPSVIISFFLPLLVLCFTSSRIISVASRHLRIIHAFERSSSSVTPSDKYSTTKPPINTISATVQAKSNQKHDSSFDLSKHSVATECLDRSKLAPSLRIDEENEDQARYDEIKVVDTMDIDDGAKDKARYDEIRIADTMDIDNGPKDIASFDKTRIADTVDIEDGPKDKARYDKTRTADAVDINDRPKQPSEQVIEEVVQPHSENKFKLYIHKLWTKLSHVKSRNKCSVQINIPDKSEGRNCSQSVAPSSSSQPTAVTEMSSTLTVPRQVHASFSLRSIASRDILAKRRSTFSRPLKPYCKLFGTVTIVIACFIIMFAPFNIAIIVDVTCHCIEPWLYEDILSVLYYMHSLVNPYIYMSTDRKYKAALKLLWKRVKKNFSRQSIG